MSDTFSEELIKKVNDENALKHFFKLENGAKIVELHYNDKGEGLVEKFYENGTILTQHVEWDGIFWIKKTPEKKERFDVFKIDIIKFPKYRLAESEEDFETIYTQKFIDKKMPETFLAHEHFKEKIIYRVKDFIHIHENTVGIQKADDTLTLLAKRFIIWVESYTPKIKNLNQDIKDEEDNSELDSIFHKEYLGPAKMLFLKLHKEYANKKSRSANYSRIYFLMKHDDPAYMRAGQSEFMDILNKVFDVHGVRDKETFLSYYPKTNVHGNLKPWKTEKDKVDDIKSPSKDYLLKQQYNEFKKELGLRHV